MSDDSPISPISLVASDGTRLVGEQLLPETPTMRVVIAHPHPQHGGNMRSLVTSVIWQALPDLGAAGVRFNFRGVEGSEGTHDDGQAERLDIAAALDHVMAAAPGDLPTLLTGWSFGADVSLAVTHPAISGWFLVAPPLRVIPVDDMVAGHDPRPIVIAAPENDQFRPPESARDLTSDWSNTRVETVPGADHFLVGRTTKVVELLSEFAAALA